MAVDGRKEKKRCSSVVSVRLIGTRKKKGDNYTCHVNTVNTVSRPLHLNLIRDHRFSNIFHWFIRFYDIVGSKCGLRDIRFLDRCVLSPRNWKKVLNFWTFVAIITFLIVRCLKRLAQRREIYEAIEGTNDLSISSSPRFVNGCCTLLEKKTVQVVRRSSGTISNIRVLWRIVTRTLTTIKLVKQYEYRLSF